MPLYILYVFNNLVEKKTKISHAWIAKLTTLKSSNSDVGHSRGHTMMIMKYEKHCSPQASYGTLSAGIQTLPALTLTLLFCCCMGLAVSWYTKFLLNPH